MLIGQYEGKISEKNQIAFPKKFREVLGNKLIITRGLDKCLIAVSEKNWETLLEGTKGKPFINKNSREMQRYILGNAAFIELDAKGRFIVPLFLKEFANLLENVIFAGIQRYVEIWDELSWKEHQMQLMPQIVNIAEKLNLYQSGTRSVQEVEENE